MANETVLNLFVSSPGDVQSERERVDFVVERLNAEFAGRARIRTIRWETRYYSSHETFQTQIPEAAACDLVVAIFGARLGSPLPAQFPPMPTGEPYPSGTAYEVLSAIEARREGQRRSRHLRLSPAERAARRPRRERSRRDRSAVAPADRVFRKVVPQSLRRVPRRVPGILDHRRIRRQGRGLPAPMAGAARLPRQGRDVGPRAPGLAVSRPRGVRREPPERVLRPRPRHRPGDPPSARSRGAAERRAIARPSCSSSAPADRASRRCCAPGSRRASSCPASFPKSTFGAAR